MPFKAQNMSNNAAVCLGGEIGRAQAMQAYAAKVDPTVDMNPILLKPQADSHSQVIVHGKVWDNLSSSEYYQRKNELWEIIIQSLNKLRDAADIVFIEGAGSAAELNLKNNDIVNFAIAKYTHSPCVLVGDIDRGGIFSQLLGTHYLLEEDERSLLVGFIVNKFRGDISLFQNGIDIIEKRSNLPVLGIIPYITDHGVAQEDSADLEHYVGYSTSKFDIAVIALPHISNFDEFDALKWIPEIHLRYVNQPEMLGNPKAIIIPGSKNTIEDMQWLHRSGLRERILDCAAANCSVVGLCGGYQMLGEQIIDPYYIESAKGESKGLGLLKCRTIFNKSKTVTLTKGKIIGEQGFWKKIKGDIVEGYEIHLGDTEVKNPLLEITHRNYENCKAFDGSSNENGLIFGTYLHGLMENDTVRTAWLEELGLHGTHFNFREYRERALERMADLVAESMDVDALDKILGIK